MQYVQIKQIRPLKPGDAYRIETFEHSEVWKWSGGGGANGEEHRLINYKETKKRKIMSSSKKIDL